MSPSLRLLREQPTARLIAQHTTCARRKPRRQRWDWLSFGMGIAVGIALAVFSQ